MYSNGPPHMAEKKQDDQLKHTYSSSVRIRVVALKTGQRRWTIGKNSERGSGISVLAARHDDDDDFWAPETNQTSKGSFFLFIYNICTHNKSWLFFSINVIAPLFLWWTSLFIKIFGVFYLRVKTLNISKNFLLFVLCNIQMFSTRIQYFRISSVLCLLRGFLISSGFTFLRL